MSKVQLRIIAITFALLIKPNTANGLAKNSTDESQNSSPLAQGESGNDTDSDLLQSNDPRHVVFHLYPDPEKPEDFDLLKVGDLEGLRQSRYNASNGPLFIIHGFMNNYTTHYAQFVKDAFLKNGFANKHNLLVVEWGKLATAANLTAWLTQIHDPTKDIIYKAAVDNVPKVGFRVFEFISFLMEEKYLNSPDDVYLLGFSLGAQVSGFAGMYYKQNTTKMLGRITGLDPAGPLYQGISVDKRLDVGDASFVDIVHSNQGQDGYFGNTGKADWYPNGGGPNQPDCIELGIGTVKNTVTGSCAHGRAYKFYVKALTEHVFGCKCISQADLLCRAFCKEKAQFGYYCPTTAQGSYYFDISYREN